MTVGERIRTARKNAGLTQKQLGEKSGIAEPTIRKYELGKLNPKRETLKKIADALEIPVIDLYSSEEYAQAILLNNMSGKMARKKIIQLSKSISDTSDNIVKSLYESLVKNYNKDMDNLSADNLDDRYPYLLNKKLDGTITPEESEELAALERLNKIAEHLDKLTEEGQEEAVKRVGELTEIPRFQKPEQSE